MSYAVVMDNRGDFGLWAIEAAKQVGGEQGSDLATVARDGTEEEMRAASIALDQAISSALLEVYDSLLDAGE